MIALALLAGCVGEASPRKGWRVFDSAFDGLENARLVHGTPRGVFDLAWEGTSAFGHKAYFESELRAGEVLHLAFRAEVGPQAEVRLEHAQYYRCSEPTPEPRPTNATVDDAWASGYVLRDVGACVFHLALKRDVVAANGVNLVWEATTIAGDTRDRGPGGGSVPLRVEASRS